MTGGVIHGGMREEELGSLGIDPADVVDLSANLHPAGPDAAVLAAARSARLDRYPAPDAGPLRDAIAASSGLDPAMVLVTPGATAAIHLVARALLQTGDDAVILGPTFGEYEAAVEAAGAGAVELRATPPDFAPPVADSVRHDATLTFLCQPNNPTGVYLDRADVERLADQTAEQRGGEQFLLVDAAYNDFVEGA